MKLDDLIKKASAIRSLEEAEVEAAAQELNLSVPDVLDLFARTVAIRYIRGGYSYQFGDVAMNQLYGFAYVVTDSGLSDFAWKVLRVFDEGEYTHDGEESQGQGEERTRKLLGGIDALCGA